MEAKVNTVFPHWKGIGGLVKVVLFIFVLVKILTSLRTIKLKEVDIKHVLSTMSIILPHPVHWR